MYVLCKIQGLLLINKVKNFELVETYMFDFHDFAYRIAAKSNTVLINFKLYRKTFIGEFFLVSSNV